MDELNRAADLFAVGELDESHLTMIGAEALARGVDSPALVELACLHRTDCRDAPELFRTALAELEIVHLGGWREREVAVRLRRANRNAAALLADEGDSDECLRLIFTDLFELTMRPEPEPPELEELAWDFYTMQISLEDGLDTAIIWDEIRTGCRNLLAGPPYAPVYPRVGRVNETPPEPHIPAETPDRPRLLDRLRAGLAAILRR
ncbi:hypothetical protein [Nocardia ignorata]|uniref:Uncharacterized protein n=2 Tax=Nocardia ignorata TaxID=145285 RepID=A0A4R6PPR0_NOCIG|nr:hypothetical protein [Nocardia ignorata]TDP38899.1 hypothetical protein DFR75_103560 [Nocardia ignorata]